MTILKSVIVATALLAGGTSLALAQNGPATGGERPVAGGANGGGWGGGWYGRGWYGGALPSTATVTATDTGPTGTCMPTIGLTGTTGIGITKQSAERCRFTDRAVA
jgi:hypothetical protein